MCTEEVRRNRGKPLEEPPLQVHEAVRGSPWVEWASGLGSDEFCLFRHAEGRRALGQGSKSLGSGILRASSSGMLSFRTGCRSQGLTFHTLPCPGSVCARPTRSKMGSQCSSLTRAYLKCVFLLLFFSFLKKGQILSVGVDLRMHPLHKSCPWRL